ncbi:hypothetical protein [Granulicella sp. WH15]|uniref:hypothetical protein n=1 Tax=Granulicella sp. WH15 TaxID=2602070 RepID=UPI0021031EA9|nr:hypothetical protein [Granulicella sp. WH15]
MKLKPRSLLVLSAQGLLLAFVSLALTSCRNLYPHPENQFAGRPIPPSQLLERVLVAVTSDGSSTGSLLMLDGKLDLRNNIQNTISSFPISGFSGGYPSLIINYPEQQRGYVYSQNNGSVATINYSTEASLGAFGPTLPGLSSSLAIPPLAAHEYSAEESVGLLTVVDLTTGKGYPLNLPNVYRVFSNTGDTVALAMVRNSDTLYRVIKLTPNTIYNAGGTNPLFPPGAIDCQPYQLPVYCVVPVNGSFDRPTYAYYSIDGNSVYVVNAGQELGGGSNGGSSVSIIPIGGLTNNVIPTSTTYPVQTTSTIPVPGGATDVISDGTNLYVAGQALQPDGLFAGNLTTINLTTLAVSAPIAISDGTHTKMLFADDNTLWVGSQLCATGERAAKGLNYNCLTRYDLGAHTASIVPAITPATATTPATVPYPNGDNNLLYYGSLTGICWVQDFHKVYTAYGGQVHAFNTADGSEINNFFITVQGTALDVAYMDALTNAAN